MIKLIQLLKELGINNPNGLKAIKKDNPYVNNKSHIVKIDDETEFTLHKHKKHYGLYPSYKLNSPKYAKIKEYLNKKGIKFEEFQNVGAGVINLRIPLNQIRLNELSINQLSPSEPTKENFIKYVKNYYHILNKLQPLIWQRYKDKNFDGLANVIIKELSKLGKANDEFIDWINFKYWLNGINKEDLPYRSSGSFATMLFDTDFIYSNGENYGLTEEEAEDLALNSTRF